MSYCYIDLQDTNYKASLTDHKVFAKHENPPIDRLMDIYDAYTKHHKWESVWPIYPEEFTAKHNNLIGYYDKNRLVAWSLIYCVSKHAVECEQFAWNYENPKLRLGIESMKTECAIYKELGYKIIILGESHNYKRSIDGFKIFGKENLGSTNTV